MKTRKKYLAPRKNVLPVMPASLPWGFGYGDEKTRPGPEYPFNSGLPGVPGTTVEPRNHERGWKEWAGSRLESVSLDAPVGENEDGEEVTLYSLLTNESAVDPYDALIEEEEREAVRAAVARLEQLAASGELVTLDGSGYRLLSPFERQVKDALYEQMLETLRARKCAEPDCGVILTPELVTNEGFVPQPTFWFEPVNGRPRVYCPEHNTPAARKRRQRHKTPPNDPYR